MIPKIIHYVWLGDNELPDYAKKNIESWKKYNPNYEIKWWNLNNFDISKYPYAVEALKAKKWAFVADIIRLEALIQYGGIYMDTDVECLKSFDSLLDNHGVLCFENTYYLSNAIMMCERDNPFFKYILEQYNKRHFISNDKYLWGCGLELTSAPAYMTIDLMRYYKKHFIKNACYEFKDVTLLPQEYLSPNVWNCPDDHYKNVTNNTVTVHHYSGTWKTKEKIMLTKIQKFYIYIRFVIAFKMTRLLGNAKFLKLEQSTYELTRRYNRKNRDKGKKNLIEW